MRFSGLALKKIHSVRKPGIICLCPEPTISYKLQPVLTTLGVHFVKFGWVQLAREVTLPPLLFNRGLLLKETILKSSP